MFFFGTRGVSSKVGQGRFTCPRCGPDAPYELRRVRRFFHLYFIPLVPLGERVEQVECKTCRATFDPLVLGKAAPAPATAFDYEFHRNLLRAMVVVLPPEAALEEPMLDRIRETYRAETGYDLTHQDVRAVVRQTEADPERVFEELKEVAPRLDAPRASQILRAARALASCGPHAAGLISRVEAALGPAKGAAGPA